MREKELADAAEIERLRKAEQKLREVQEEKRKRRKEKKIKMKEESTMKLEKYPDDLASVSTFAQPKQEIKVERPLFSDSASEAMQPINLKNQRVLQPEAQTASA